MINDLRADPSTHYLAGYYLCRRHNVLIRFHSYWCGGSAGILAGDNVIVPGHSLENKSGWVERSAYWFYYPLCKAERWCRGPGPTFERLSH